MKSFDLNKYKSTEFIIEYRAIFLLLIAVIYASFFVPYFATERNITQVLTQFSIEGIIAVGLTILMIAWGIDLSVGSTMAFGGLVFALTQNMGITIAAIFGILAGTLIGLINGLVVVKMKVNFFIATLASMITVRGIILVLSDNSTIYGDAPGFGWMGKYKLYLFEFPVLVFIAISIIAYIVMNKTKIGTYWYAIGGNIDAARRSGLPVDRIFILAFVIVGFCSGIAGVLLASRSVSAAPGIGKETAIFVISAAVIGGTSLFGGKGHIQGAVAGILLLGVIRNSINLLGISAYWQYIIQGTILVSVVLMDVYISGKRLIKK